MIRFLSVLLVLFLCQPLAAQPALSLSQAIKNGLRNAYQIQIAEKDLEIARNNNTWQNTDMYPTVDFILSIRIVLIILITRQALFQSLLLLLPGCQVR